MLPLYSLVSITDFCDTSSPGVCSSRRLEIDFPVSSSVIARCSDWIAAREHVSDQLPVGGLSVFLDLSVQENTSPNAFFV